MPSSRQRAAHFSSSPSRAGFSVRRAPIELVDPGPGVSSWADLWAVVPENRFDPIAAGQYGFAMQLEFHDDPAAFLEAAGDHLAADPVLNTVVATVTRRAVEDVDLPPRHGAALVAGRAGRRRASSGVAMRTAPFAAAPAVRAADAG